LHDSIVRIGCKIKKKPKGQDTDALVFRSKPLESGGERLQFPSLWVVDV
jgi:hypothetical protein